MDNQQLASLSDRLFGQILDSFVAVGAFIIALILYSISPTIGGVVLIAAIGYAIFYILFADGFVRGQSYGKRILNIAVVSSSTGEPCTYSQSFLRNLLLTLLGIIDWVFIFGKKRQRLGDKAAGTIVIKTVPA